MLKEKMNLLIKIFCITVAMVVLAAAPYFLSRSYVMILRQILVFAALSLSWYFFSGITKYISLGSVAFVGTGIYFTSVYLYGIHLPNPLFPFLPFPVIVILAGLICFALAFAIGLISLRLKGIYFAIATFGVGQLVGGIFSWWQNETRFVPINIPIPVQYTRDFNLQYYSVLTATVATFFIITTLLLRSKFGLALRMIGDCEEAAAHSGVNTTLYKTLGFAISAFFMGLAGGSYTISFYSLNLSSVFSVDYSFLPPVMVLLGGVGTVYGSMIGPPLLILISEYLRQTIVGGYYQITYGIILVIIVLFAPNGIMGVIGKLKSAKPLKGKIAKPIVDP